ncbi:response regulator [Ferruginibacter albus]|uniref:response regulator n=1 Tax=Ferruginibacter albus TaxID=2875540 RepID=UPI001CC35B50|nr:response regulator [Ferruginibacter albus]UAY53349.1 response regulator [Ferruginibacter albus]
MKQALIIDDEIDICYLLSSILKNKSISAKYVNTLSEASEALQGNAPDFVFLDNHLPDGTGLNYISHIKKHSPDSKIIMITAYDNNVDRNKAAELGVDRFISKPFTIDTIYQTVEQLRETDN